MRIPRLSRLGLGLLALLPVLGAAPARFPLLTEIDHTIRDRFWDPNLKSLDWEGAVAKAAAELAASPAPGPKESDAIYDRLLASLADSHTFRVPAGRLPEQGWSTAGLRIGQDGGGYAVKGVIPAGPADAAGLRIGDRVLAVDGKRYGAEPVNFRDLFFVFEGANGSGVDVTSQRGTDPPKTQMLRRIPEPAVDTLFWKSARVIRKNGKAYGYAHLWGLSAEAALAMVDLLSDKKAAEGSRPNLGGLSAIDGFLLDVRGNSGGYDPNILPTFLRGQWNAADYYVISRDAKRLVPPVYEPLPVALLTNSGTVSNAEALALKFRAHRIGPIVGERTAGMASGGAAAVKLSDGSILWFTERAIESLDGKSYEGRGVEPDVAVADRPAAAEGQEDAVIEAAIKTLAAAPKRPPS
jgi:carboxyl-terminal processing protease